MTKVEASEVTDVGTVFNRSNIVQFVEFQYFGVTSLSTKAFELCSKLIAIHLPYTLIRAGSAIFSDCWGLKKVWVEENFNYTNGDMFTVNVKLQSIYYLAKKGPLGSNSFGRRIGEYIADDKVVYLTSDADKADIESNPCFVNLVSQGWVLSFSL